MNFTAGFLNSKELHFDSIMTLEHLSSIGESLEGKIQGNVLPPDENPPKDMLEGFVVIEFRLRVSHRTEIIVSYICEYSYAFTFHPKYIQYDDLVNIIKDAYNRFLQDYNNKKVNLPIETYIPAMTSEVNGLQPLLDFFQSLNI